jgi:hypothetical protein
MLYDYIIKSLDNAKHKIYVESTKPQMPKHVHTSHLPEHEGFIASRLHARKTIDLVIKNEHFYIIDGYVSYKRPVKHLKNISYERKFLFFKKRIVTYTTDEEEILKYFKDNKISYKKDFDEETLNAFYYFWKPAYAIMTHSEYEEIDKRQFSMIRQKFQVYKVKVMRKKIKEKENYIKNKARKQKGM